MTISEITRDGFTLIKKAIPITIPNLTRIEVSKVGSRRALRSSLDSGLLARPTAGPRRAP